MTDIIHATLEENLEMIRETVEFLRANNKEVIFDAEHFFTGYNENAEYAMKCLEAAVEGGAKILCLCETKGGMLPMQCYNMTKDVSARFGKIAAIGVHTHNDSGCAVANSLLAVEAGATHVQGVLLGFGERTGNANLSSIIADLQLKMDCSCIPAENMQNLTPICKRVAEITNIALEAGMPYVGGSAFAHKAGMHIDAVIKNPFAYEHVTPESVGNERVFLMSEVAGKSMIVEKVQKFDKTLTKSSPIVAEIVNRVKELEHQGYQFEGADASFEILVRKAIGKYQPFYNLHYYKTSGEFPRFADDQSAFAQFKIDVDGKVVVTAGDGDGPVNALDVAMRKALEQFYPNVAQIHLTDYKVRVLDGKGATASRVRVLIESSDGDEHWATMGVSSDVIEASYIALVDSFEYKLIKDLERKFGKLM